MISTTTRMTAHTPSCFGMPISGATTGAAQGATGATPLTVVRDRYVGAARVVKGAFPGTTAWRPPTC